MSEFKNKSYLKINRRFYVLIILFTLFFANYIYLNKKTVNISIIYTSDIKGNIFSIDKNNQVHGLVALPYILKQYKNFMLIDLGNSIHKTPESILTDGLDIAKLLSDIGYDAINIGSYELSWGMNKLYAISNQVNFPLLSSNLSVIKNDKSNMFLPYFVKEIEGIKIGVIGLFDKDDLNLNCLNNIENLELKPIFQTLKKYVEVLKENEKADVVILLSRYDVYEDGDFMKNEAYKIDNIAIANNVSGIDLIISKPKCNDKLCKVYIASDRKSEDTKTIICNTIPELEYIGKTNLVIRKKSRKIVSFNNELIPAKIDLNILEKDKKFLYFKKEINSKFDNDIGRTGFKLIKNEGERSNIGALITDVMRKRTGADIAVLGNKYISNYIKIGKITNRDIFSIFSNNCEILTLKMEGKNLLKLLEKSIYNGKEDYLNVSGFHYYFDRHLPIYSKVKEIIMEKEGEKFDIEKIYKVAILESMVNNNNDLYKNAFEIEFSNYKIQDILLEYISTYIPVEEKYNNYDEKIKKIYRTRNKEFVYKGNN